MNKLIWIDDLELFKVISKENSVLTCVCDNTYQSELNMNIGDTVFIRHEYKAQYYKRLGSIVQFKNLINITIEYKPYKDYYLKESIETYYNNTIESK